MRNLINRDLAEKDFTLRSEKASVFYSEVLLAWGCFGATVWMVSEFFLNA